MEERGGPQPIDEAIEITLQALDGLEYAHSAPIPFVRQENGTYKPGRGLVHRDLKPANLFLSGAGSSRIAKIGDFGLTKAFDQAGLSGLTRTGTVAGTPSFMPRQQVIEFKYAEPDADVWAMAASLYCMLTGSPPRDFPDGAEPWLTIYQTKAVPIRNRNATTPKRLAEVIDHALIDEPEISFKTAADLRDALESAV